MARLLLLFFAGMIFTAHVSGMYEVSELFLPFKKDSVFRPKSLSTASTYKNGKWYLAIICFWIHPLFGKIVVDIIIYTIIP